MLSRRPRLAPFLPLFVFTVAPPAHAASFGLFQYGGRAAAQAGAFVARADDPTALAYNPAGLARLDDVQLAAGLDFDVGKDELAVDGATSAAEHVIQFPPHLFASWKPAAEASWTVGFGVDSPIWTLTDWKTTSFPARFETRRFEATLFEARPAFAWAPNESWSFGIAGRYVSGTLSETVTRQLPYFSPTAFAPWSIEADLRAKADVDGYGFEVGAQYTAPAWGFGIVAASGVELDGDGDLEATPRNLLPGDEAAFAAAYPTLGTRQDFELPPTLSAGTWWSLGERWTIETDLVFAAWSELQEQRIETSDPTRDRVRPRDWDDVLSIRVGAEMRASDSWSFGAGLAFEPSPVPDSTAEPGLPRGDATVVSLGASYSLAWLSFDLGYSLHAHDDRTLRFTEGDLVRSGTVASSAQIFSASARWRLGRR